MLMGGIVQAVAVQRLLGNCAPTGLKLGRQAAWRPGVIGMVSSGWWAALCAR